ncbi:MAG: CDP-glucose 4,6-dehydratase, partial [Bacillota bacterium]
MTELGFYRDKKVFVTGHTGFKGTWLCHILRAAGAQVTGYALVPPTSPSLFALTGVESDIRSVTGDIRDPDALQAAMNAADPEIVLHLAAQPLVRESYQYPVYTYGVNVMGTVNLLEAVRQSDTVRSVVNVTTDKVYLNQERAEGYREDEELKGFDPYSNSKSCSELVTYSYKNAYFAGGNGRPILPVSTARAGNVIGGGDFAKDRILPDCVRAAVEGKPIAVRNPRSTRPYQHVLEPLFAYLMIARRQYENPALAGAYNVGPDDEGCYETGALVDLFIRVWGGGLKRVISGDGGAHEANYLKLDCTKLKSAFGWQPRWALQTAVEKTVEWTKVWQ